MAEKTAIHKRRGLQNKILELQLSGWTPSKKNDLRWSPKSRRPYYGSETRTAMDSIRSQLERQWRETTDLDGKAITTPKPPLAHPAVAFAFYVTNRGTRSDRDGAITTILDEMVNVGIIPDDCIADFNGPLFVTSAVTTDGWAGARIFIEPSGNFGRLWRYVRNLDLGNWSVIRDAANVGGFKFGRR